LESNSKTENFFKQKCIQMVTLISTSSGKIRSLRDKLFSRISNMYEITPFIFLGNHQDAEENIAIAQVNCTKDLPRYNHSSKKFYRVPVNDDLQEYSFKEMTQELPGAVAFIDECVRSRERVLVHCFAGQQRSCAVIAAYFASKGIPVQKSVEYLRSRKPDAFNRGVNFQKSLDEYVKSLKV